MEGSLSYHHLCRAPQTPQSILRITCNDVNKEKPTTIGTTVSHSYPPLTAWTGEIAVEAVEIGQHVVLGIVGLDQMRVRLELEHVDPNARDRRDIPPPSQSNRVAAMPDIQCREGGGVLDSSLLLDEFGSGRHCYCAYLCTSQLSMAGPKSHVAWRRVALRMLYSKAGMIHTVTFLSG